VSPGPSDPGYLLGAFRFRGDAGAKNFYPATNVCRH